MNSPTYRQIADAAKVSIFSVSCALRNRPGVSEATRKNIRKIASQMGYKPNPLVTALMTGHRRGRNRRMRAILAVLTDRVTRRNRETSSTNRESYEGYVSAFGAAGFLVEEFLVEDYADAPMRFFSGLRFRNAPGVLIQAGVVPDWGITHWKHLALASVGNRQFNVPCHLASTDHYRNSWLAMTRLVGLGYKRIGFAMSRAEWVTTADYRALSASMGWAVQAGIPVIPPHWTETWESANFLRWVEVNRLEAVVAAEHEPLLFLQQAGYSIPRNIGFAHLGLDTKWDNLAGVRQNNFQVGEAAAQLVMDQINRNSYGPPQHPCSVQVSGDWFQGPTIKAPGARIRNLVTKPQPNENNRSDRRPGENEIKKDRRRH